MANKKKILSSLIKSLVFVLILFGLWFLYQNNKDFKTFIDNTFKLQRGEKPSVTDKSGDTVASDDGQKTDKEPDKKELQIDKSDTIKGDGGVFVKIDDDVFLQIVGGKENLVNVEAENRIHKSTDVNLSDLLKTKCFRVSDGDTIWVQYQDEYALKLRLIGVDTPEKYKTRKSDYKVEHFGKEASKFTTETVFGQTVYLAFGRELTDVYNRFLTYVYLENGECLNSLIIKEGYGFAYRKYPHKFMDEFIKYENQARQSDMGLWKEENQ